MLLCSYMSNKKKQVILAILDGWGIAKKSAGNAVEKANTPTIDAIERTYFSTSLQASGIAVGLPWAAEGNSEVGHMNIGAGYIVYQYLPRITNEIRDGSFFENESLLDAVGHVKRYSSRLHIMGLLSSGSVHSSIDHLYALLDLANKNGVREVIVHAFTDGVDSNEREGIKQIQELETRLKPFAYKKAGSVVGRIYAMNRNNNWDLTKKTYDLLVKGVGKEIEDMPAYMKQSYAEDTFDTDTEPAAGVEDGTMIPRVSENDALIFFNFREDSARQITKAFISSENEFDYFERSKIKNLFFVAMTEYSKDLPMAVAYAPPVVPNPLAKVLSDAGMKQLHIAESEKYAHITFFFNGTNEIAYDNEERILITSDGDPHHEKNPKMGAHEISEKVLANIDNFDFFLVNFANADILGHTGNIEAVIKGVEAIDTALSTLVELAKKFDIALVITADHGNAERMMDPKLGQITPKHSKNPVPFYIVDKKYLKIDSGDLYEREPSGILADVAPTILKIMGIDIPPEMTGRPLIVDSD